MKLFYRISYSIDLLLCAVLILSCGPREEASEKISAVEVDPPVVNIMEGGRLSLKVNVQPEGASWLYAEWSSSDEAVAQVNKAGTLKAIAPGTVTVTATVNGVSGSCSVTVTENVTPVSGIILSATSLNMGKGTTETLTATIEPADAADKQLTWTSSDNSVATVEEGRVTALSGGECDITATSSSGISAVCHVKVSAIPVEALAFSNGSPFTVLTDAGETYTLIVTYTPANTSERELVWTSSDESLASIAPTAEGQAIVTFAGSGTGPVTVTAKAGNPERTATQQFFVQGAGPLVNVPQEKFFAGKKARWSINTAAYPSVSNVRWESGGKTTEGPEASFAPAEGGENTAVVSADFAGLPIRFALNYTASEWFINQALDGANPRNTYPVFNKAATRAYFVTRGARRLYEINLEEGSVAMLYNLNDGKNDNGGDICVNPVSGDIYCSNQQHIYCISPEGQMRWEIPVPTCTSASSIAGGGPALSNDCSVVFIPAADKRVMAVDAASGTILDSFSFETTHIQLAVYGNDQLVMHSTVKDGIGAIRFTSFSGGKFSEVIAIDSPANDPTDITSPAISRDQKTAWFPCNGGKMVVVDLPSRSVRSCPVLARGYLQGISLVQDGAWMFFASQNQSQVNRADPASFGGTPTVLTPYTSGNDSHINFTTVASDAQGNIYFFIKEDGAGNSVFYRLAAARNWQPEVISSIEKQNNDPQGFFNFGGGYLIGGGGQNVNNRLLVRCIDAERSGWSGPGGDICATKNANLVYGN